MTKLDQRAQRVLVIRFSAIGDIILTTPVLAAFKDSCPDARLDFVTKTEFKGLIEHHPAVDQVFAFDAGTGLTGLRDLAARLSLNRYDLILDLHRNLRGIYLRAAVGAADKRTYPKYTLRRLILKNLHINLMKNAPPVVDRYFGAVEDLGIKREGRRPRLFPGDADRARADEILADGGSKILAVSPGASYPTKQWPAEKFARVALSLAGKGLSPVLVGGRSDRAAAEEIMALLGEGGVEGRNLCGELSITESAAVIGRADLVITNDSGLMHVADALDRPLVSIFGPTSRELGFFPLGEKSRVIEVSGLECRPCTLHGDARCPKGHHRCMAEIEPSAVIAAALEVMEGG